MTVNQLILLVLQAIIEGQSSAEGVSEYQFNKTRRKLREMAYLYYSYSDKGWHLNERGDKLMKDLRERVIQEIIGGNN